MINLNNWMNERVGSSPAANDIRDPNLQPASVLFVTNNEHDILGGLRNDSTCYFSNDSVWGATPLRVKNTVQHYSGISEPQAEPVSW